jgi:hypothetical protein
MTAPETLFTVERQGRILAVVRATRGRTAIAIAAELHGIHLVGLAARVATDFERQAFRRHGSGNTLAVSF